MKNIIVKKVTSIILLIEGVFMMKKKFIAPVFIMASLFSFNLISGEEVQATSETTQLNKPEIMVNTTTINTITNYSNSVTGTALPNSFVIITEGPNNHLITAGVVDSLGNYDIPIPLQSVGTVIHAQGLSLDGIYSNIASTTVVYTTNTTTLNPLTNLSTNVTGTALPNSHVIITNGNIAIAAGKADSQGHYDRPIPMQPVGTVVTAIGILGNVQSDPVSVTVTQHN